LASRSRLRRACDERGHKTPVRWNLLDGDVLMPAMVLEVRALEHDVASTLRACAGGPS
jgi:hypothetical protein